MHSEDFYIILGAIGFMPLLVGSILTFSSEPSLSVTPAMRAAGGFILMVGIIMYVIIGIRAAFDIRSRMRGWNISRKSDDLHLREKERELRRREQECYEEDKKEESHDHTPEQDTSTRQPHSESTKQSEPKAKTTDTKSPFQDTKTFEEVFGEEPILKTGGGIPSNLKKKTEEKSDEITEPVEKESEQEEYVRYVKHDQILRGLWYLHNSKEGFFLGQTEAARIIFEIPENEKVSGSRREDIKATMNELQHYGLIAATVVKDDIKGKQLIEYKITPKGKELMKRAVDENVKRWVDFVEKYKFELKK